MCKNSRCGKAENVKVKKKIKKQIKKQIKEEKEIMR